MKPLAMFVTVCMLCALCASPQAQAAEKTIIHLFGTPFGTGSYILSTALESIVNQGDYALRIAHVETPGQAYNVNKLNVDAAARQNTVVTASQGINWLAGQGKKPFPAKRTPLKLIGVYTYTATWLVTGDKDIKSVADLRGKRIAMGRIPQVIWGYEPDALLRYGYGDDFYKSLKIQFVGTSEAATALVNGQVDAATIGGYMDPISGRFSPAPQTVEVLASGRKLRHLDWTRDAVEKTAATDIRLFAVQVPAKAVEGLESPIWIGADLHGLFAHPDFPEEYAYILARSMIENIEAFGKYHALGGLMSRAGLVKGFSPEHIHPGALRAYQEAGIL